MKCPDCGHSEKYDHRVKAVTMSAPGFAPYSALRTVCHFEYGDEMGHCDCQRPLSDELDAAIGYDPRKDRIAREECIKRDRREVAILVIPFLGLLGSIVYLAIR